MQRLFTFVFVVGLIALGTRWAMVAFDDAQLKNDITGVPGSTASNRNHAHDIAINMQEVAERHHCEVIENGIDVDLAAPVVRGKPPNEQWWQMVNMHLQCKRPNVVFAKKTLELKIALDMMVGGGEAEHWP